MNANSDSPSSPSVSENRVLFVVNVAWFFVSHRLNLAKACIKKGQRVSLGAAFTTPQDEASVTKFGIDIHKLNIQRSGVSMLDVLLVVQLYRLCCQLRPSVIHLVTIKPVVFGGIAARLAGARAVVFAISGLGYTFIADSVVAKLRRAIVIRLYRLALGHANSLVIFQNTDDMTLFEKYGMVRPNQSVIIEGAGVNTADYSTAYPDRATPLVLLPARLLRDKGIMEFAQAAKQVRDRGTAARFLIAGGLDEDNPSGLSQLEIDELQSAYGVEWIGFVDDMADLLRTVSVVCLPSYREGLPKALLEAAAAARPIIATDVPGCRVVVAHEENGVLVPKGSVNELADAMDTLLRDRDKAESMGRRGRQMAVERWDTQHVTSATLAAYERLLEAAHG